MRHVREPDVDARAAEGAQSRSAQRSDGSSGNRALAKARSKKSLACLVGDWRSSKVAGSGAVS